MVTIPRELRDRFKEGAQVEFVPTEDGAEIRPVVVMPEKASKELLRLAEEARQGINTEGPLTVWRSSSSTCIRR